MKEEEKLALKGASSPGASSSMDLFYLDAIVNIDTLLSSTHRIVCGRL
jgi:hypothetical protein